MTHPQNPSQQDIAQLAELSRTIGQFLDWAEQEMGLLLCEAYKPKYAWYTPTSASLAELLAEFLGDDSTAREPVRAAPGKLHDSGTATSTGHGRPSRQAVLPNGK